MYTSQKQGMKLWDPLMVILCCFPGERTTGRNIPSSTIKSWVWFCQSMYSILAKTQPFDMNLEKYINFSAGCT